MVEWDSKEWRVKRDAIMSTWMLGERAAVECVVMLSGIAECWDDIIDEESVSEERIHRAFTHALVGLQLNQFYERHKHMLLPVVIASINAWLDANNLQSGTRHERMAAFFLRNLGYELATIAAFCVGGWDHMREVSLEMRKFFWHETFEEWEHGHDR